MSEFLEGFIWGVVACISMSVAIVIWAVLHFNKEEENE